MGKEYAGSRVSRADLEAESDDDPFAKRSDDEADSNEEEEEEDESDEDREDIDEDDEIDSADAFGESDEERFKDFKFRASKQSRVTNVDGEEDDEEEDEESEDGIKVDGFASEQGSEDLSEDDSDAFSKDEDEDEDEDEEGDLSDEDEEDDDVPAPVTSQYEEREELRRLMATDQKTIAATISQAAKADAVKGFAVKQQRSTFDALLNTRIKLQKGLSAINTLPIAAKDAESVDEEAIRSAESAALTLWSTLEDLRLALSDAQSKDSSKKRKRPSPVSSTTSSASLWKRMADLESESVAHRRAVLDKWSLKVRGTNATIPNTRGKLLGNAAGAQQTITAVLDAHIATESGERASKRARNLTTTNGTTSSESDDVQEPVYDDTLFYQSLLRDLVEQRMSSSDAITNGVETLHIQLPAINPMTGMRKDKVKRVVDTKASKGRKMQYTVHEKLQNFMVPEDRGTWTNKAREEFFASLLGKTASGQLQEDDEEAGQNGVEDSDEDVEEGGLRLFRS